MHIITIDKCECLLWFLLAILGQGICGGRVSVVRTSLEVFFVEFPSGIAECFDCALGSLVFLSLFKMFLDLLFEALVFGFVEIEGIVIDFGIVAVVYLILYVKPDYDGT
jgi:hypothetical protein